MALHGLSTIRAVVWCAAAGVAAVAHASAPGLQDPGFGSGGVARVVIPDPGQPVNRHTAPQSFRGTLPFALAVQPDGKVVTAGDFGPTGGGLLLMLMRHDASGALDPGFGSGGIVTTTYQRAFDVTSPLSVSLGGIALQPDGKIVVAFTQRVDSGGGPSSGMALARFNADGTVDGSFGSGGIARTTGPDGDGFGAAVVSDADGNFVVAGFEVVNSLSNPVFLLARFDQTGTLDPGFGTGGLVTTDFGSVAKAYALVLQPDDRIVVAGEAGGSFALARYEDDGTLDGTFGTGGVLTTDVGGNAAARALLLQPDGDLVAGGYGDAGFPLARYDTNGALDPGFGSGGITTTSLTLGPNPGPTGVRSLVLEPDGRIDGAGENVDVRVVLRWQSDGTLDPTFGSGGIVRSYVDSGNEPFAPSAGLALLGDGRLLTADREANFAPGGTAPRTWMLTRYLGGRCGNGVTEAGEDCDDGNLVDGDGCPSSCCLADADGDGICDSVDPCTGGSTTARPRLAIRRRAGQRNSFVLKGEVTVPQPFTPALDPSTNGIRILISDTAGPLLDVALPPGLFTKTAKVGWKVVTGKWTYVDRRVQRPFGTRSAMVKEVSPSVPGLLRFSLQSKFGSYGSFLLNLPLTAQVALNGAVSSTGQCADVVFLSAPPCTLTPPGTPGVEKLDCK